MFYAGRKSTTVYSIGLATSSDGINWTKHASNPLIIPGATGQWDDANVRPSCPVLINGIWYMWYWGFDGTNHFTGVATSTNLITWYKKGKVFGDPAGAATEINPTATSIIVADGATPNQKIIKIWYTLYTGVVDGVSTGSLNYGTITVDL